MRLTIPCTLLCILALLSSCKKEGVGGDATIRGYVHVRHYNSTFTQFISAYPGKDIYLYIVYGDRTSGYNNRTKTDYNGNFEFRYLYKGNYKVYVYSKDSTLADPSGLIPVVREIEISERKEEYDLDTLLIYE